MNHCYLRVALSLALSCMCAQQHLHAQALRYQDEAGNIFFVDKLSDIPQKYRSQVVAPPPPPVLTEREYRQIARIQAKAAQEQRKEMLRRQGLIPDKKGSQHRNSLAPPKQLGPNSGNSNSLRGEAAPYTPPQKQLKVLPNTIVEVFVAPACKQCPELEQFFKQNRVKYKRLDIITSQKAFEQFDALGAGNKLPVTKIGNKVIRGLDYNGIKAALSGEKPAEERDKALGSL
jgi:glutaredoxin 3